MSTRKTDSRGNNTPKSKKLQFERLEHRRLLAGDLELVKDIYVNTPPNGSSNASNITRVGAIIYLTAPALTTGEELWKSDGTTAGTVQVKDIFPGTGSSTPRNLTNVNGTLYFSARDAAGGIELWKSDGTIAGTVLVKDILAGTTGSNPTNLTNLNGTLYFRASDAAGGYELWKSDGTAAGTVQVKDILTGTSSSSPRFLTNVNGTLYFSANDSAGGNELWKSDGTATGTVQVKDIFNGTSSSTPRYLTNVNGTVYFNARDAAGYELWKSDGTALGTIQVKDIFSGTSGSFPRNMANVNGTLYFSASDSTGGDELWKSDGSTAGTVQVKDIFAGTNNSSPRYLTNVNGTLYFSAADASGRELWKSDGTSAGTVQVKDIFAGTSGSYPTNLANVNGTIYFTAIDTSGRELWKSDGTPVGTVQVKDIIGWIASSYPRVLTNMSGTLYFNARDAAGGYELWKSDGTTSGTIQVKDIFTGTYNSSPGYLTNVNGRLYFSARDSAGGIELWKSDGTTLGTVLVKDIFAGTNGSSPRFLTNVSGTLYFSASDSAGGYELWKSDGTATGTVQVKDIFAGTSGSSPRYLTNVNGTLYFSASDSAGGMELWKSDGTAPGTVLVKDIFAGTNSSSPRFLTNVSGTLYFSASDAAGGKELWKSDGTTAGTVQVKDIFAGTSGSTPTNLTNVSGTLYFSARDAAGGYELRKSDGTTAGTLAVKDIFSGVASSNPTALTNISGWLVFQANDGIRGDELWVSDGSEAGTRLLSEGVAGTGGSLPSSISQIGTRLLVAATSEEYGRELWRTTAPPNGVSLSSNKLTIDLGLLTTSTSVNMVVTAGGIVISNSSNGAILYDSNVGYPILNVRRLEIVGSLFSSASLTINHSSGVIDLPLGIAFHNSGSTDTLTVIGVNNMDVALSQSPAGLKIATSTSSSGLEIVSNNLAAVNITGVRGVESLGVLDVGIPITVSHQLPFALGSITNITGGSLTSNSAVSLGSGKTLQGAGNVSGRVTAEAGSIIHANGNLTLGNSASVDGFLTRGDLQAGTATVTLLDSDQAVLGALTSLGNAATAGSVVAANGALINSGTNLVGFGTLSTPNLSTKPTVINGSVAGTSIANPITLAGFIKGVGTLNNVLITGTFSPDFIPAAVALGSVRYASSSVTVVELGGTTPGVQYDQLNHNGQAILGGTLDLELINGYQPTLGASFTILTATGGVSGAFNSIDLPPLATGLEWQISYGTHSVIAAVQQINYAPTDLALSSSTIAENRPANSTVGSLTTVDANSGEVFTYSLVSGNNSADNGAFTIVGSQLLANSSFNFESKNSFTIRVRTTDSGGLSFEKVLTITVENVLEMPAPVQIGDGTAQRSLVNKLVVSFDQAIEFDPGAFQVYQRTKDASNALVLVPVTTNVALTPSGTGMTATLSFAGSLTRGSTNALVDGNYQLSINGGLIRILGTTKTFDADGDGLGGGLYTLGTQAADNFFALYGDTDGDGLVGVVEFGQFRSSFGKSSTTVGYDELFDYEGDGSVGVSDFGQFRSRFGKSRPPI